MLQSVEVNRVAVVVTNKNQFPCSFHRRPLCFKIGGKIISCSKIIMKRSRCYEEVRGVEAMKMISPSLVCRQSHTER
jgi:hypothetical protein